MNNKYKLSALVIGIGFMSILNSCSDKRRNPGSIYAPDMTYSRAYDAYTKNDVFADGQASRKPVEGTIARGESTTPHLNVGDSTFAYSLQNPITLSSDDLKEGERLFNIHCAPCHGVGLDGQGPLYTSEKYPLAPANLKDPKFVAFSEGKLYYTIMFGKNRMGSYASQLDEKQRWLVIGHIKNKTVGVTTAATTTSTSTDTTASTN